MSKRNIILAVVSLLVIIIVAGGLIFRNKQTTTPPAIDTTEDYSPFGSASSNALNATTTVEQSGPANFGTTEGKTDLVRLSGAATAGGTILAQNNVSTVRFIERTTGNIFDYTLRAGTIAEVSNTTVPHIAQSFWSANSKNVVLQYSDAQDTISTYLGTLVSENKTGISKIQLQGKLLQQNISAVAVSPSGAKIFYLLPVGFGVEGYIANIDGTKATKIFSSQLSEFNLSWPQEGNIVLATKSASSVPGFVYALNTNSGAITQLLGGINGLSAVVDPTLTKIAYSDDTNSLRIFSIKDGSSVSTGVSTLADKCVWATKEKATLFCAVPNVMPANNYPDVWYQGLISFTDSIVKIDSTKPAAVTLSKPFESYKQAIDATDLSLSPAEDYLLFTNKKDYTLWSLSLK